MRTKAAGRAAVKKWKFEKARQLKKAKYRKEKFLKNNVVSMTTDKLVKIQSEIKVLSDDSMLTMLIGKEPRSGLLN